MRQPFVDLLALPCAGASATMYLRWRRLLPEWIRVVPVELPGRGARLGEAAIEDFDQLVGQLAAERAEQMAGRYALFGHSMGALLAHGLARRQQDASRRMPLAVFVSGSPGPSMRDPARFAGKDSDAALIADLREQGGTPDEVFANAELLRLTLDTLRADYGVCRSFEFRPAASPLAVPVHAFAGRQDRVEPARIEAWRHEAEVFSLDWFEGGHFFIRQQESQVLAALVRELTRQFSGRRDLAVTAA